MTCTGEAWWMHRTACAVVNSLSLSRRRGQTKQLHKQAYFTANKLPPSTKPGVCHHF